MSQEVPAAEVSLFRRWMQSVLGGGAKRSRSGDARRPGRRRAANPRRRLLFESLEIRQVMATNLGEITGRIFVDATGNGFTAGEQVIGASIELYQDNGDNAFNIANDAQVGVAVNTDANGIYTFSGLSAGTYFVRQPAQTVGARVLDTLVGVPIVLTALEAQGVTGATIDRFLTSGPSVTAAFPIGTVTSASLAALPTTETIGGERDLSVELTAGGVTDSVSFSGGASQLNFNSDFTAQGRYTAVWDGADGASAVAANGLGAQNLLTVTGGTINAIRLSIGADQAGGTIFFRIHSGVGNISASTPVAIPVGAPSELTIPLASFATTSGTGGSLGALGALELVIEGTQDAMDGRIEFIDLIGPTSKTQNFDNPVNLSITKTANSAALLFNETVTYTVTVTNAAGVGAATNLVVTDLLPAGDLTFVSATPSQGAYDNATGVWTVGTLHSGDSVTLSLVARVADVGTLTNTATITSSDQFDTTADNNTASAALVATAVDLAVTKTVDDSTPNRNQNVTFTVTVTNQGTANGSGIALSDPLPAGLTFVSSTPSTGSYDNATGIWTVGALNAGAAATLQIVATTATTGVKTNTAQVSALTQTDFDSTPANNNAAEDDQASVAVTPNNVDLAIAKTVDVATPNRNQNVTFTVTLSNAGPTTATGATVSDTLPAGVTFVSATPSTGTYDSTTGVWSVPTLVSGGSATLTMVGTVTTVGAKTNTATTTAVDQFDTSTGNDTASVTITPRVSDVSLAKTVDDSTPDKNQNVTFTVTATNLGPDPATNVTVSDTLPTGVTFVSATPSTGTYTSATGVWTIPSLASAASATLQMVGTVATVGTKTNTATVSASDSFDSVSANNTASVDVTPNVADLSVVKAVDNATPNIGDNVTFTVTVSNAGPVAATNVALSDPLPTGLTFVSSTPSQGTFTSGTGAWTVGTVASGSSATLQVTATVATAGAKTNTAQVSAVDQFDPDSTPANSLATEDDQAAVAVNVRRMSKRRYLAE